MSFTRFLLVGGSILLPSVVSAQDSTRAALPAVRVTATREGPRSLLELPYAVTVARADTIAAFRRLGVDELLFAVPGVALANRQNPAQDTRISIRGFGARSAFGVRGVRVLQDGVPVTLPDGQTPTDALDVEGADRVDVVRGSASSLYGNAAGGVIDLRSASAPRLFTPFARVVGGGFTPVITAAGASGTTKSVGITSSLTRIVGRGFRDHSSQRSTRAAARLVMRPDATHSPLTIAARISDVDDAENPGALTRAQFDSAPRMADPLAVRKGAGKTVRQGDIALTTSHGLRRDGMVGASVYLSTRTLENPLTFAIIDVDRTSGGLSLRASDQVRMGAAPVRLAVGADAQWQRDERREFENCIGAVCAGGATVRGRVRRDQRELVTSVGPYVRAEVALGGSLLASAGMRSDAVRFEVRDHFVSNTNPDDSGDRTLRAVSPALGVVWRTSALTSVYANVSSSFETPTTTELANKPDGSAGINPELQPQRTLTLELGSRGLVPGTTLRWDVAAFESRAREELVPFDIVNGGGRRYFRNAGRTSRRGAEVGVDAEMGIVALRAAYGFSHFRYVDYAVGTTSFAGRRIPGVPRHVLSSTASMQRGPVLLSASADLAGEVDVNDANSAQAPGRALFGVALGTTLRVRGAHFAPFIAIQNIGGVSSVGSVNVNAAGGKFYEPAPGRTLLLRLAVTRDSRADH